MKNNIHNDFIRNANTLNTTINHETFSHATHWGI